MKRVARPAKKPTRKSASRDLDENYCSRLRETSDKTLLVSGASDAEIQMCRRQLRSVKDQLTAALTEISRLNLEREQGLGRSAPETAEGTSLLIRTAQLKRTDWRGKVSTDEGRESLSQAETALSELQGYINSQSVPQPIKSASNRKLDEAYEGLQQLWEFCEALAEKADYEAWEALEEDNKALKAEVKTLRLKEEESVQCRVNIDKLREQISTLKQRLPQLAVEGNLKKLIDKQTQQISCLEHDKTIAESQVKVLTTSVCEQGTVIEQLRRVISSFAVQSPPSFSKFESSFHYDASSMSLPSSYMQPTEPHSFCDEQHFFESPRMNLQDEINDLDLEIQQLQSSLDRALTLHR
jgi:hypothetical protein